MVVEIWRHNIEEILSGGLFPGDSNKEVKLFNVGTHTNPQFMLGIGYTATAPAAGSAGWAGGAHYYCRTGAGYTARRARINIGTGTSASFATS